MSEKNPYKLGTPCYLAYEEGYISALDDVQKLMGDVTYGRDHEEERAGEVPGNHQERA